MSQISRASLRPPGGGLRPVKNVGRSENEAASGLKRISYAKSAHVFKAAAGGGGVALVMKWGAPALDTAVVTADSAVVVVPATELEEGRVLGCVRHLLVVIGVAIVLPPAPREAVRLAQAARMPTSAADLRERNTRRRVRLLLGVKSGQVSIFRRNQLLDQIELPVELGHYMSVFLYLVAGLRGAWVDLRI